MADDIRRIFATNVRQARVKAGLSQEALAEAAEVDRSYVSSLERCVYAASIDVVDRIAKVLDIEAAELLRRPQGSVGATRVELGG